MKKRTRLYFLLVLLLITIGILVFSLRKDMAISAPSQTPTSVTSSTSPANTTSTITILTIPTTTNQSTATVSITTPPVAPPPVVIEPLNYHFGISTGDTLPGMSTNTLDAELNDIASLHVGWIRLDMAWNDVQPTPMAYNWSGLDRVLAAASARGIKVLPILDYTPAWARTPQCAASPSCIATAPSLYEAFVRAAVTRYASQGITTWEIWNEPNLAASWEPQPSVAQYVVMLQDSYTTIKGIEPNATVITGGLGPTATMNGNISPTDFLTQIYADGGKNYFNAVGDHPYSYPATPQYYASWNAWSQISQTPASLRSIMLVNGDSAKQIWITEYGAPTGGPGNIETSATDTAFIGSPDHVSEALQAEMLAQAVTSVEAVSWTGPLFWYSYKDLGTSNSTNENFFGLIRYDGSTKPAYQTLKELLM